MENQKTLEQMTVESFKFTELLDIFHEKYLPKNEEAFFAIHNKIADFCQRLFKKYGYEEVIKRRLFHLIVGSSEISNLEVPYFDFEGDDSIEKFIREL